MTELEFRQVLRETMCDEYNWAPAPQDLHYTYTFSPAFEVRMQKMMEDYTVFPKPLHNADRHRYVGRFTLRRVAVVILAAVLVLALAACTVYYIRVHWNETQNDAQGTLDITFDVERSGNTHTGFEAKRPQTPEGFTVVEELEYPGIRKISYEGSANQRIDYTQEADVDMMSISVDSDDDEFTQITVNGYKGYAIQLEDNPYIVWTDDVCLYQLSGTVPYAVLEKMAESIE